jgi:hypothetical protein
MQLKQVQLDLNIQKTAQEGCVASVSRDSDL